MLLLISFFESNPRVVLVQILEKREDSEESDPRKNSASNRKDGPLIIIAWLGSAFISWVRDFACTGGIMPVDIYALTPVNSSQAPSDYVRLQSLSHSA